ANQTVVIGQAATFSVVASGTVPLTYQWMENTGSGFNNISGANSSSYTTPPAMSTDDGTVFEVLVTNADGSVASNSATLTVTSPLPPTITTQPANQTVTEGQTATFSVVASGTAPLTYQWMENTGSGFDNISGATSSSYTTPPTVMSTDNGAVFEVTITNGEGSVTSNPATLTVNAAPPTITTQPATQMVLVGQTATFSVVATGTAPLTYQWMANTGSGFNNISGAISSSYTTPPAMSTDDGTAFQVVVTNAEGSATSNSVTLTVTSPVSPTITTQPANQTVIIGQTATFSVVATGTAPLTYQWMENTGSGFNNISGATSSSYTTPSTMSTDTGTIFEVTVSNAQGSVTSNPATLTANTAISHYVYVITPGPVITVYDMDNSFAQVKQIAAGTSTEQIRGAVASAVGNFLYISYGCSSPTACTPYLMKYDLLADAVVWNITLSAGIDSFSITPDGTTIYMPSGEGDHTHSLWYIIDSSAGNVTGTIDSGVTGPHNTIVGNSGAHVYMGSAHADANGDGFNYLVVANTSDGSIVQRIGPVLNNGTRPFTIDALEQYAFIIPWGLNGFQVGSISTGSILFTAKVTGFSNTSCSSTVTCSHGVSLSPDGTQIYVVDYYNNYVHVFNVTGLPSSAPVQAANIPLTHPYTASGAWLTHSHDGKFVFVAESGDVIDTSKQQVVGYLPALNQTPVDIEIDFQNGVISFTPLARSGVGYAQ
ncbi:MAG TPA: immunoglobulin domain-containing protein, partial [Candidatus Acidoferrales bacterium]|nr:immunoglobulin domain-containing protein [Candidatus Acidoferrales bacterium]